MKNKKIINEISRIMEIMKVSLINEAPVGPRPKFSFNFDKTHKSFDDASIKKFNLDIDNGLPTVTTKKKLTTAAELDGILDNFSNTKWDEMKPVERKFLFELNNKMADADPGFLKNATDDFFTRIYKDVKDPLSKVELLDALKSGFNSRHQLKIDELLTVKSANYNEETKNPITKWFNKITGSNKNTSQDAGIFSAISVLLKNKYVGNAIGIGLPAYVVCNLTKAANLCQFAGDKIEEMAKKLNFADGQELFLSLLIQDPLPTSDVDSLCEAFGRDKSTIQKDVDLFYNMGDFTLTIYSDVTLTELVSIITNLGKKYDGFGLILFNKLFESKDPQGKNIYQWLISEDISDQEISSAVKKYVPIDFSIFREMKQTQPEMTDIELLISKYLNLTNTGTTGVESIFIKIDEDSWTPIGKSEITTNYTTDGKQIILSVDTQIEIKQKAKELLTNYLSQVKDINPIPTTVDAAKSLVINQPGQETSWLSKLDWESVDKVLTPQLDNYFKDTLGKLSWNWYHATPKQQIESKIGLSNLLLENKKKILTEGDKIPKNTGGGSVVGGTQLPPTPFTTKAEGDAFRAWVIRTDAAYATQIVLSATGPINNSTIRTAYKKYGTAYQNSLSNSGGGNAQQITTEDKAKEIFNIYSKKIWFYNKNNVIFNLQEFNKEIGDWINYFISEGFNQPSAFLGAILMNYGTQLTQYQTRKNVQDEIDKNLTELQDTLKKRLNIREGFKLKKLLGLAQILEQISEIVIVNIVNGIPKKTTEDDNYIDTNSKTIESVIEGGDEIRPKERNSTVKIVKPRVGYTVSTDAGNNFTENFKNHLLKYKSEKLLDYNNPNITQQLLCSFDDLQQMYPDWCKKFKKPTPTPSQTTQTNQTPEDIADINSPIPNK